MVFLYGILCLAVVMDLFTFRISNRIILAGYLAGICYRWLTGGWIGTGRGILEAAVFFLLLIPVYRFGAVITIGRIMRIGIHIQLMAM